MSHTPNQAKTLWCPMVRLRDGTNVDGGERVMCCADPIAEMRRSIRTVRTVHSAMKEAIDQVEMAVRKRGDAT